MSRKSWQQNTRRYINVFGGLELCLLRIELLPFRQGLHLVDFRKYTSGWSNQMKCSYLFEICEKGSIIFSSGTRSKSVIFLVISGTFACRAVAAGSVRGSCRSRTPAPESAIQCARSRLSQGRAWTRPSRPGWRPLRGLRRVVWTLRNSWAYHFGRCFLLVTEGLRRNQRRA